MVRAKPKSTADFIVPININGMRGRMLRLPARRGKKREMLLVYPHHSSLERFIGLAELFNDYGGVTAPDMPGFGGMDSFHKVDIKPELDSFADYLATFIKLRYRNRRFTLVGVSFGFMIATRMLQKYPEIAKKVDLVVSIVGLTHYEELKISGPKLRVWRSVYRFMSHRLPATFFRNIFLHPRAVRYHYSKRQPKAHKLQDFEVFLWRKNDLRTHMLARHAMLTTDNCGIRTELPLCHAYLVHDKELDNKIVEQHMQVIFANLQAFPIRARNYDMTAIQDKKAGRLWVPTGLRLVLKQQP